MSRFQVARGGDQAAGAREALGPRAGAGVMAGLRHDTDITLTSRYECKYRISPLIVPELRHFIQPFVEPDYFAALHPDYRYAISSLYLDSDDLLIYGQTLGGLKNRFKLRVRSYSDEPDRPVYCELKQKLNNIVSKLRAPLTREDAVRWLRHGTRPPGGGAQPEAFERFAQLAARIGARPFLRVRYMREAYESRGLDPVRITLDTQLAYAVSLHGELALQHGRWVDAAVADVVLEIKFTERFPPWVHDVVRSFGLKQQPVPKYSLSVERLLEEACPSVIALGSALLTPQGA
ncbi:MAG TPA: polyphosphate polymerase domain-containing protein [Candidatus Polarisedimenticolaceae bacterium]|nr:polyphosphate polymerase domain-containing protein [Candidatus Polarisedimenticolaceae bacterium]